MMIITINELVKLVEETDENIFDLWNIEKIKELFSNFKEQFIKEIKKLDTTEYYLLKKPLIDNFLNQLRIIFSKYIKGVRTENRVPNDFLGKLSTETDYFLKHIPKESNDMKFAELLVYTMQELSLIIENINRFKPEED